MSTFSVEQRWLSGLLDQIDFQLRGGDRGRKDNNFDWEWFRKLPTAHFIDARRYVRRVLYQVWGKPPKGYTTQWLQDNYLNLWQTRMLLTDALSRRLFDDAIVLKIVGYRRAFYPPEAFDTYLEVMSESQPFSHPNLPHSYMGTPLHIFDVHKNERAKIIATLGLVESLNLYRQYFVERDGINFAPQNGEVVLDCGACVGEIATIFAMHVGETGQVHLFDPMPAHVAFCNQQKILNSHLANRMHVVPMAVGATSNHQEPLSATTAAEIQPNAITDASFPFISIDDYVHEHNIRVDVIKMDIEGGEYDALQGAKNTLVKFKPRLMISAYHRPDDLWVLRQLIQQINPNYKFYFGHHTPVQWESVLYAV